jgi:hypothetical protein
LIHRARIEVVTIVVKGAARALGRSPTIRGIDFVALIVLARGTSKELEMFFEIGF